MNILANIPETGRLPLIKRTIIEASTAQGIRTSFRHQRYSVPRDGSLDRMLANVSSTGRKGFIETWDIGGSFTLTDLRNLSPDYTLALGQIEKFAELVDASENLGQSEVHDDTHFFQSSITGGLIVFVKLFQDEEFRWIPSALGTTDVSITGRVFTFSD